MIIKEDGITIRNVELEDAELLNNWWNDGEIMAHAGFPNGLGESLDKTKKNIMNMMDNFNRICIIEVDGKEIGELNYRIDSVNKTASVGWKLCDTSYQNKGLGTKIIKMTLEYIFMGREIRDDIEIDKILWDTMIDNERAQYVYENKIGARKIGINKDIWTDQLGRLRTSVDYEISREEFLNVR